jgi:hypothetical protein
MPAVPSPEPEPVAPEIEFERDPVNFVVVEPDARLTHPLVRAAAAVLRGQKPDYNGLVHSRPTCIDLRVAPASVTRALRIMEALIPALEKRGYLVAVKDRATRVTVLGEKITFYLRERFKRMIHDLTPDERRRRREGYSVTHPGGTKQNVTPTRCTVFCAS